MPRISLATAPDQARDAIGRISESVGRTINSTADTARDAVHAAGDRLSVSADQVSRQMKHGADVARDNTHQFIASASESGAALLDRSQARANRSLDSMQGFVHRHPIGAIAIAGGIGLVLGRLSRS